jgi:glycogen debranching enzyme
MTKEERVRALKCKVDNLKEEYGLLGIIDIVLNHTAGNSEWLLQHPEAAFNTNDCPHLTSAYVLDRAIADFSADYANKRNINGCPSAPYINNEGDIQAALKSLLPRL